MEPIPSRQPPQRRWWRKSPSGPEALFLEHLELIERVATSAARGSGFDEADVEDFVSTVKHKLIDDDYAVLRRHRGDSKLTTYLVTVIHNLFRDYRNHKWGKYRPSAVAKKMGRVAVMLERFLVRDQHDLDAAIEMVRERLADAPSRDALHELAGQLPHRTRRSFVGDEVLAREASETADPEERALDNDRGEQAKRLRQVVARALGDLEPQDALLLKMHFGDGETIASIASALHVEQRPLYTRKNRCLRQLRRTLQAEGLTWEAVQDILDWRQGELELSFGDDAEEEDDRQTEKERRGGT